MGIKLKGVQCKIEEYRDDWKGYRNVEKMFTSDIICGGVGKDGRELICWAYWHGSMLVSRCRLAQADSVFMFITAILVAGAAWLGWMRLKRAY